MWTESPNAAESTFRWTSSRANSHDFLETWRPAIFRIIQEALTNVFRHSKASKSWVVLSHEGKGVVVMVRDDGKGLPEEVVELRTDSVGVGLEGMRQRSKQLGGEFRLNNANPGTLLEVIIPSAHGRVTRSAQVSDRL